MLWRQPGDSARCSMAIRRGALWFFDLLRRGGRNLGDARHAHFRAELREKCRGRQGGRQRGDSTGGCSAGWAGALARRARRASDRCKPVTQGADMPQPVATTCPYCGVGCGVLLSPRPDSNAAIGFKRSQPSRQLRAALFEGIGAGGDAFARWAFAEAFHWRQDRKLGRGARSRRLALCRGNL